MTTTERRRRLAGWLGVLALTVLAAVWAGVPAQAQPSATETDYGRMILVLDSSGSMKEPAGGGATKIEAAKDALGRVVDDLPDDADVGLRVFGATVFSRDQKGACTDSQLVVEPGTGNREELRSAVADYEPYGETPIAHALQQAARDIGAEGTRSIVLVSDGVATCQPDPCRVAAALAKRGIDLQIDVVGLSVDPEARAQLRCIAAAGNGTYYDADSADDIVESLDTAASRALRPFELEGRPLAGGTAVDPTPVEVGQWVDEIGLDPDTAERWFRYERTIPGSTVHVSVASLGHGSGTDAVLLSVGTDDGDLCGNSSGVKQVVSGQLIGVGVAAEPEDCDGDSLLIDVRRALGGIEAPARFSLKILEEPPVESRDGLPGELGIFDTDYTTPQVPRRAQPVTGGTSFGEATEVEPGTYEGTIVPGETQAFKVPVAFGQTLSARVVTPPSTGELGDLVGAQGPFAQLAVYNPMRAEVPSVGAEFTSTGFAAGTSSHEMTAGTGEVRYLNRGSTNPAYLDGDHYVVFATDEDYDGRSFAMPYTLQIDVTGEESGVPTYVGGQQVRTGEEPSTEPTPEEEPTTDAPAPSDSRAGERGSADDGVLGAPLQLVAAGGLGLVAVAAVAVGVLLLRRSRPQG